MFSCEKFSLYSLGHFVLFVFLVKLLVAFFVQVRSCLALLLFVYRVHPSSIMFVLNIQPALDLLNKMC